MQNYPMGPIVHTIQPNDTLYLLAQRYNTTVQAIIAANPGTNLNTLYIGQRISIWPGYRNTYSTSGQPCAGISEAAANLRLQLHKLWQQHVYWTRMTIISMVFNLPDVNVVTDRLLRNPKDFEALLRPLYGDQIASRFADLFTSHLAIAAQLVKAAIAGDSRAVAELERTWYANASEIASFLASINPYWSQEVWQAMLFEHLRLTKSEAVNMINKNYQASINVFDEIENQALRMADVMVDGIIRQFPEKF